MLGYNSAANTERLINRYVIASLNFWRGQWGKNWVARTNFVTAAYDMTPVKMVFVRIFLFFLGGDGRWMQKFSGERLQLPQPKNRARQRNYRHTRAIGVSRGEAYPPRVCKKTGTTVQAVQ